MGIHSQVCTPVSPAHNFEGAALVGVGNMPEAAPERCHIRYSEMDVEAHASPIATGLWVAGKPVHTLDLRRSCSGGCLHTRAHPVSAAATLSLYHYAMNKVTEHCPDTWPIISSTGATDTRISSPLPPLSPPPIFNAAISYSKESEVSVGP